MKIGDTVTVWPHGDEKRKAEGKVLVISQNGCSLMVGFPEKPPFVRYIGPEMGGLMVHPEHGIVMMAMRELSDGKPIGPWIEIFCKGHYEIEAI